MRRRLSRGPLYDAGPEWLKARGLTRSDAENLFRGLCVLVDYEGKIKDALAAKGGDWTDHHNVCNALRYLVDGE